MKLHVLSDLHTELADFSPPATDADVVILAGDIGVGFGGIEWASHRFPDAFVVYIPGNHEFYGTRVVCNPRGYPSESSAKGFLAGLVVEV